MTNQKTTKNKSVKLVTPRGVLKYPHLTKPDYGTDKYPDKEGAYRTQFILNKQDAGVQEFLDRLDALMAASKQAALAKLADMPIKSRKDIEAKGGLVANKPYSEVYDEETEEATGEVELRIRKKASFKDAAGAVTQTAPPPLFDSASPPQLLPKHIEVWGGTKARLNVDVSPYFMNTGAYGLSLRLGAVQILKLVDSGGAKDASSYGFDGGEDEGYVFAEDVADTPDNPKSDDSEGDDADF